jgi:hypothetical protein
LSVLAGRRRPAAGSSAWSSPAQPALSDEDRALLLELLEALRCIEMARSPRVGRVDWPIENDYNLLVFNLSELATMIVGLRDEV